MPELESNSAEKTQSSVNICPPQYGGTKAMLNDVHRTKEFY